MAISFRITLDDPPSDHFSQKQGGGVIYRLFFFGIITVFVLPPKKCLKYWSIKTAKENFRFFFVSVIQQKKSLPVFYLFFFFGANTSQISGKLLKHQEVKTKTSVFFSFCHSCKTKTFHSSCLLKLLKHLSRFESK